jgi:thymidylate synthase (FAD)
MKLIKPSYEILNKWDLDYVTKEIEKAARTCYKSEDKICEGSDLKLIRNLINNGHEAMLEFGPSITVRFTCDRGVSHELVRHRIASFAQESTRYCDYSGGHITFIIPNWFEGSDVQSINLEVGGPTWLGCMEDAEESYNFLIESGWKAQQARSVLPNSLKTEINIKANIREWRHIFKLRTDKPAHPQMRELMIPLLEDFNYFIPVLFGDIRI